MRSFRAKFDGSKFQFRRELLLLLLLCFLFSACSHGLSNYQGSKSLFLRHHDEILPIAILVIASYHGSYLEQCFEGEKGITTKHMPSKD